MNAQNTLAAPTRDAARDIAQSSPLAALSVPSILEHGIQKVGSERGVVLLDLVRRDGTLYVVAGDEARPITPAEHRELRAIRDAAWKNDFALLIAEKDGKDAVRSLILTIDPAYPVEEQPLLRALFEDHPSFENLSALNETKGIRAKLVCCEREPDAFDRVFEGIRGRSRTIRIQDLGAANEPPVKERTIAGRTEEESVDSTPIRGATANQSPTAAAPLHTRYPRWDPEKHVAITTPIDRTVPLPTLILQASDPSDRALGSFLSKLWSQTFSQDPTELGFHTLEETNCVAFEITDARIDEAVRRLQQQKLLNVITVGAARWAYLPIDRDGPAFTLMFGREEIPFPSIYDLSCLPTLEREAVPSNAQVA